MFGQLTTVPILYLEIEYPIKCVNTCLILPKDSDFAFFPLPSGSSLQTFAISLLSTSRTLSPLIYQYNKFFLFTLFSAFLFSTHPTLKNALCCFFFFPLRALSFCAFRFLLSSLVSSFFLVHCQFSPEQRLFYAAPRCSP
jgi:hypothetical protein